MIFGGLIKQSLVDYPGEVAAVVFTRGCNLRCPFCQNAHLLVRPGSIDQGSSVPVEDIMAFLYERRTFLDALVVSGGEPTLHQELPDFIHEVKNLGYKVKLDTNGSNPAMLEGLLNANQLDYVAMDIKAPLDYKAYQQACGKLTMEEFFSIRSSVHLLMATSIDVEFRTTLVPCLHSALDVVEIGKYIKGARLFSLQQFNPSSTLHAGYGEEIPYSKHEMNELAELVAPLVQRVRVVNI